MKQIVSKEEFFIDEVGHGDSIKETIVSRGVTTRLLLNDGKVIWHDAKNWEISHSKSVEYLEEMRAKLLDENKTKNLLDALEVVFNDEVLKKKFTSKFVNNYDFTKTLILNNSLKSIASKLLLKLAKSKK